MLERSVRSAEDEAGIGFEIGIAARGKERLVECFACLERSGSRAERSLEAESFERDARAGKVNAEALLASLSTVSDMNGPSETLGCADAGTGSSAATIAGGATSACDTVRGDTGRLASMKACVVLAGSCQPAAMTARGGDCLLREKLASWRAGTGSATRSGLERWVKLVGLEIDFLRPKRRAKRPDEVLAGRRGADEGFEAGRAGTVADAAIPDGKGLDEVVRSTGGAGAGRSGTFSVRDAVESAEPVRRRKLGLLKTALPMVVLSL